MNLNNYYPTEYFQLPSRYAIYILHMYIHLVKDCQTFVFFFNFRVIGTIRIFFKKMSIY